MTASACIYEYLIGSGELQWIVYRKWCFITRYLHLHSYNLNPVLTWILYYSNLLILRVRLNRNPRALIAIIQHTGIDIQIHKMCSIWKSRALLFKGDSMHLCNNIKEFTRVIQFSPLFSVKHSFHVLSRFIILVVFPGIGGHELWRLSCCFDRLAGLPSLSTSIWW